MKSLKGKFAMVDLGPIFRTGEIVDANDEYILIKYDFQKKCDEPVMTGHIVSMDEIASAVCGDAPDDMPAWSFYDSREDLNSHLNWLQSPSEEEDGDKHVVVPIRGH
jgi:hypothetical protein